MPAIVLFALSVVGFLAGSVAPALAAGSDKASEAIFVLQIVLLVVVGRGLGEAMQRIGQPAVMGQLAGGILLGPSVLGVRLAFAAGASCFPPTRCRPG